LDVDINKADNVDIIGEARKALSEGREPPLPLLSLPTELAAHPAVQEIQHQFGLTPNGKSAIPAHLRTSSTQVEPATPPRWMTYAEAEETVKKANEGPWRNSTSEEVPAVYGKKVKKERPTGELDFCHIGHELTSVSHMMKLFGQEYKRESGGMRKSSSYEFEPNLII
jgi:protein-serine/threonine kinase